MCTKSRLHAMRICARLVKRTIMVRETVVAITGGELDCGTWEQIFFAKFDGMMNKRVLIRIMGE